ncbi:hypothetical protein ACFYZB_29500 [Streptomyces sp. NPDC001852]|uniref:hypothetical protein n=1 Tax=Streptomyces sp. NPDC001852 TaxID=3364619 RepID=UPI00368BF4D3
MDLPSARRTGGPRADLPIVRRVVRGPTAPVLCSIASSPDDLLVIGMARPRGPAAPLHRRPVHRHIPARARCEVLVVAGPGSCPLRRGSCEAANKGNGGAGRRTWPSEPGAGLTS